MFVWGNDKCIRTFWRKATFRKGIIIPEKLDNQKLSATYLVSNGNKNGQILATSFNQVGKFEVIIIIGSCNCLLTLAVNFELTNSMGLITGRYNCWNPGRRIRKKLGNQQFNFVIRLTIRYPRKIVNILFFKTWLIAYSIVSHLLE